MAFNILIAEDEEITLNNILETLQDEGYSVSAVKNGSEALAKLEKNYFDLLITDIKMPGLSGIELLEKVKEKYPEYPNLSVVFSHLTATKMVCMDLFYQYFRCFITFWSIFITGR